MALVPWLPFEYNVYDCVYVCADAFNVVYTQHVSSLSPCIPDLNLNNNLVPITHGFPLNLSIV